tara:strand:+ start:8846 stop:9187 length:342 start_codon:yes stop_codon:yes gene_type:complete
VSTGSLGVHARVNGSQAKKIATDRMMTVMGALMSHFLCKETPAHSPAAWGFANKAPHNASMAQYVVNPIAPQRLTDAATHLTMIVTELSMNHVVRLITLVSSAPMASFAFSVG